jgi:preprotein translocase subunit SecG
MAFGGGATDALFGAGSGNVLTKITKYAGGIFFILAITMAMVAARQNKNSGGSALTEELSKQTTAPAPSPAPSPVVAPMSNSGLLQTPLLTNLPPVQSTASGTNK